MPQKSVNINTLDNKSLQFHQMVDQPREQSQSSSSNRRILILKAPLKLKSRTANVEQRTIPLGIDNSRLTITSTENKNKIVSLKRGIESQPLALPINQLNQKSPTIVKNEVGQVMGKLIPLGKFTDITKNSLAPINAVSSSPVTPTTESKISNQVLVKTRENKILKLEESFGETLESEEKTHQNFTSEMEYDDAATAGVSKIESPKDPMMIVPDAKPKKRVHLVLKGYKNMASIGQTGTKIKLIPLDHWKLDAKSNLLKTQPSNPTISQPKIVDVRSCSLDEMNESEDVNSDKSKLNCNYVKEDFDIDNILEEDPLAIGMLSGKTETFPHSFERNTSKNVVDSNTKSKLPDHSHVTRKPDSLRRISESGRLNTSKVLTLAKGGMSVELRFDRKSKPRAIRPMKTDHSLKNSMINSTSQVTVTEIAEQPEPVIDDSVEDGEEEIETQDNCIDYDELYERFGLEDGNVTPTETAMLAYICDLKQELLQCQRSKAQALAVLQPRENLGNNNLSNIQKRFVELQLKNSGKIKRKQRFGKTDIPMARDILKATGPKGYINLRKIFSLPDMNSVLKGMPKT